MILSHQKFYLCAMCIIALVMLANYHQLEESTPDEVVRGFILKFDKNKDGKIDRQEFVDVLKHRHFVQTHEEAKQRLKDGDKDGDGLLSWNEYIAQMSSVENKSDPEYEVMQQEERDVFVHTDKDSDDKLNSEELAYIIDPLTNQDSFLKHAEMVMKSADKDGDEKLNREEMIRLLEVEHGDSNQNITAIFESYDKNHDNFVEMKELLQLLTEDHKNNQEDDVKMYFNSADSNQDGFLNHNEIIDHYDSLLHLMNEGFDDSYEEETGEDDSEHQHHDHDHDHHHHHHQQQQQQPEDDDEGVHDEL